MIRSHALPCSGTQSDPRSDCLPRSRSRCRRSRLAAWAGLFICGWLLTGTATTATPGIARADARTLAEDWLRSRGWSQGFDRPAKRLVIVVSEGFSIPQSPTAHVAMRDAAFERAMAEAQKQAVEYIAAEVATAVELKRDLQEVIGDPALAKTLTGAAADEAFRSTDKFRELVSVIAEASLAGMYTANSFESADGNGMGQVALVAVVGPGSEGAMRSEKVGDCDKSGLDAWLNSIDHADLVCTRGVRFAYDNECRYRPIAFAQAAVRPEAGGRDAADKLAEARASKLLNEAVGSAIRSKTLSSSVSESESATGSKDSFRSIDKLSEKIEKSQQHTLPMEVVKRWVVDDPHSGAKLAVVAVTVGTTSRDPGPAASNSQPQPPTDCPAVPERMAKSVRQTRASGTGPTKVAAIETALLEAVRREGASVKGNSLLERQYSEAIESVGKEVREKASSSVEQSSTVKTFSNGFVYSYEVLTAAQGDGLWEVEICANLVRFDPKDPRFGLPPTVAVMPVACTQGSVKVGGAPFPCAEVSSTVEQALDQALAKTGAFMVIGERDLKALGQVRQEIAERVAAGNADEVEALKLGRALTADFVLYASVIRADFSGEPGQRPRKVQANDSATATISAKMLNVASGEVAWSKDSTVTLIGRQILLARAGKGPDERPLQDPADAALSPLQLAVCHAVRQVADSIASRFPPKQPEPAAGKAAAPVGAVRIHRVSGTTVTLDAEHPSIAVGARFVINLLVDVDLGGGRVEVDRDYVATLEVTSVNGALAKARVVAGDASKIDPAKCEAVQETRSQ